MKWSWEGFSRHTQTICAILMLATTIFLLVQTIILTKLASQSSWTGERTAEDIRASKESLAKVQTDTSELVMGLTGEDSQLMEYLGGLKNDAEATKNALDRVGDDIDDIRSDVRTIEGKIASIEELLSPPSD
jgi:peptidoglycan hydrolase CwlO-like protein